MFLAKRQEDNAAPIKKMENKSSTSYGNQIKTVESPKSKELNIPYEICSLVLGELMQWLMSRMLGAGVSPQDIVRRITQEQALRGSRFSEFKEVLIGMVESHSFELSMYETVVSLHEYDLFLLQRNRITHRVLNDMC